METTLTYLFGRNLFRGAEFKPFVRKYFKDVKFEGFRVGRYRPSITISNWDEIKDILPKSYQPHEIIKNCK